MYKDNLCLKTLDKVFKKLSINELGKSKLEVTWYDKSNKYFLQSSTDLINWFNLDAQSTDSNGEKSLVIEKDQNMLFLRLYYK